MTKSKKILSVGLVSIAALAIVPLSVVACSSGDNSGTTGQLTNNPAYQNLVKANDAAFQTAREKNDVALNEKTILITAGGKVNDLSFNQSVNEALTTLKTQTGKSKNFTFAETPTGSAAELQAQYRAALAANNKYWVLTGFQQGAAFVGWLNTGSNRQDFIDKKVIVIAIDWTTGPTKIPAGQFISINFKTQEASWEVGFASAKFISENYANKTFNTFGGGAFPGVTNFNAGFLQGVLDYNNANYGSSSLTSGKLKFTPGNTVTLNTNFAQTPAATTAINTIVAANPQVILPVAGALTSTTVNSINTNNGSKTDEEKQFIIGVDSDQSKAFTGADSNLFFSSIEKNVAGTTYTALSSLYLGTTGTNPFFEVATETGTTRFVPIGSTGTPLNIDINKGFTTDSSGVNFVGFSASSLAGTFTKGPNNGKTLKEVANTDLAIAKAAFGTNREAIIAAIPPQGSGEGFADIQTSLDDLVKKINA